MSFVPADPLLKSPASFNAPLKSGGDFLSGILGATLGASNPALGILGALAGGPDAALQPDVNTLDGRQQLSLSFSSPFAVGRDSTATSTPTLSNTAADSTKTAPAAGGPAGLDTNKALLFFAAIVGGLILFSGSRRP